MIVAAQTIRAGSVSDGQPADQSLTLPGSDQAGMHHLADRVGAFPLTQGNHIDFYHHSPLAFDAMLQAMRSARHHIHLEFFIVQPDELGRQVLEILTERARAGVQVRLLYDAMGSHRLKTRLLEPLQKAGGRTSVFLPLSPLRRRIQINMRNHRKILIVDGVEGFTGGLNIGNEYLGLDPYLGYWRDTAYAAAGPGRQSASARLLRGLGLCRERTPERSAQVGRRSELLSRRGRARDPMPVQVVDSGPDRDLKSIREVYFAAILQARRRVWIASPYFVPDAGILDALRLAAYLASMYASWANSSPTSGCRNSPPSTTGPTCFASASKSISTRAACCTRK